MYGNAVGTTGESYPITAEEYERAKSRASKKLEWIIERYGDDGGERRAPYYLEQLIEEAIASERFSRRLWDAFEDKKRTARAEAQGSPEKHPHYSIA